MSAGDSKSGSNHQRVAHMIIEHLRGRHDDVLGPFHSDVVAQVHVATMAVHLPGKRKWGGGNSWYLPGKRNFFAAKNPLSIGA